MFFSNTVSQVEMKASRLKSLQVGRAIAALLVVAFHASSTIFESVKFWNVSVFWGGFDEGYAGVYFFFVLSGFIIAAAHSRDIGKPAQLTNYGMRRIIRVYPVYWVVLIPVVIVYLLKPTISKPELTSHWVMANSFILIGVSSRASLAIAWTLFHEMLFYILFAVLIVNRRTGEVVLLAWFVSCIVASIIFGDAVRGFYPLALINILFGFGLLCFLLTQRYNLSNPNILVAAGSISFVAIGLFMHRYHIVSSTYSIFGYGASSAIIVLGLVWRERIQPIAVARIPLLLGDASYSIYLTHYTALSIVARLWINIFKRAVPADIAFFCIVAICAGIGVAFHLIIEKPMTNFLVSQWRKRRSPVDIATVQTSI